MNSNQELTILTRRIQSLLAVVRMEVPKDMPNKIEVFKAIDAVIDLNP